MKKIYVVYDKDCADILGAFTSRADAEEAIMTEAEWYVYEVICTDDPQDMFGESEWDFPFDYDYLLRDTVESFEITEVNMWED